MTACIGYENSECYVNIPTQEDLRELIKKHIPKDIWNKIRATDIMERSLKGSAIIRSFSYAGDVLGYTQEGDLVEGGFFKYKIETDIIYNGRALPLRPIIYNTFSQK